MNNNTKAKAKLLNGKDRSRIRGEAEPRNPFNKYGKVAAAGARKKSQ